MTDYERIQGAVEVMTAATSGKGGHARQWALAWIDAMQRIDVKAVRRACRGISFDGSTRTKAEARFVLRMVTQGAQYARLAQEIEDTAADLYPKEQAKKRLDTELGWEHHEHDALSRRLDRSMMIGRLNAPPDMELRYQMHDRLRGKFDDLRSVADMDERAAEDMG